MVRDLFSLAGKIAVITGGAGTLGSEMARGLGAHGATVILLGRTESSLRERVDTLREESINADYEVADVLDRSALEMSRDRVIEIHGHVDILVNAAGGNLPGATIPEDASPFDLDIRDFRSVIDLNLTGTVLPTLIFAEGMVNVDNGSVINLSSMASTRTITRVVGYSAAKAGIDNFTRWMAVELAIRYQDRIRVNAIAPGFFLGEQNRTLLTNSDGSLTSRGETIVRQTPMRRLGEPEELVSTVVWLCSDHSRFVTGITVPVDGGFSAFSGV